MRNPRIHRDGSVAILPESGVMVTGLSNPRENPKNDFNTPPPYVESNWHDDYLQLGDFKVAPDGPDNLFPYRFKQLIDQNNILHPILRQKIDLLLTGGWYLYREVINKEKKKIEREPVIDREVSDWLESWDFDNWLLEQTTDFIYLERNGSLMIPNRARRLAGYEDKRRIAEIRYLPAEDLRMEPYGLNGKVNHYYMANWFLPFWNDHADPSVLYPQQITQYPAFEKKYPFKNKASVFFVKMPTFCSKYYGRPPFIGIADYLKLKELIINWSIDNLKHTAFKWHIESPFDYWEKIKNSNGWDNQELEKYEGDVLGKIDKFLANESGETAAKRFHSKFAIDERGEKIGWKLTALEDNTEKNSKAFLDAQQQIDESIIAATHLDPALANIQIQGKLSSGLDKLIAYNVHQLTSTPIPRQQILSPVNTAIRINWPGKDLKIGIQPSQLEYQQKALTNTKEDNDDN